MEKILFVADADRLDINSFDFATFLSELSHSKLAGIFMENMSKKHHSVEVKNESAVMHKTVVNSGEITAIKEQSCEENIRHFLNVCDERGINCLARRDRGIPLEEIIMESRYSDLLLIDVDQDFVKNILINAKCPVVINPARFDGIEQLVFTYDGQPSSLYAIKQFTYLFPELGNQPVVVITVNVEVQVTPDPEERYKLEEWLKMYYKKVDFLSTEGNARSGLQELLLSHLKAFIVMGAYGRSALSVLFNSGDVDSFLRMTNQPVFIAHR